MIITWHLIPLSPRDPDNQRPSLASLHSSTGSSLPLIDVSPAGEDPLPPIVLEFSCDVSVSYTARGKKQRHTKDRWSQLDPSVLVGN